MAHDKTKEDVRIEDARLVHVDLMYAEFVMIRSPMENQQRSHSAKPKNAQREADEIARQTDHSLDRSTEGFLEASELGELPADQSKIHSSRSVGHGAPGALDGNTIQRLRTSLDFSLPQKGSSLHHGLIWLVTTYASTEA